MFEKKFDYPLLLLFLAVSKLYCSFIRHSDDII